MARLFYVTGDLDVGGAERHIVELLPELARLGHQPEVFTLTHRGRLAERLINAGIPVYESPFGTLSRKMPRALRRVFVLPMGIVWLWLRMLIARPHVVHFFLPMAYIVGALVSLVTPVGKRVMSRRSLNVYQQAHPNLVPVEAWLHRRMDAVLGNSKAVTSQLLEEGTDPDTMGLIYNGIDIVRFDASGGLTSMRSSLGISEEAFVMILVANLIPYKGHADLIDALALIKSDLPPDWSLLCVGEDRGIEANLRQQAESSAIGQHIHWLGEREDVISLLVSADLGLLVSHQEGFSNAILEGMAVGLAQVVTDVGGNAEAVINGETGFVVPAHDPKALGRAIVELAGDAEQRSRMGRAGRARMDANFTLSSCVARYHNLYTGLQKDDEASVQEMIDGKS